MQRLEELGTGFRLGWTRAAVPKRREWASAKVLIYNAPEGPREAAPNHQTLGILMGSGAISTSEPFRLRGGLRIACAVRAGDPPSD